MLKIVATISDFGAAANVGGNVGYRSYIIEIPTQNVPAKVKEALEDEGTMKWTTVSLSFLDEED